MKKEVRLMQASYENPTTDIYCRDTMHSSNTLGYRPHLHYEIEFAVLWRGHTHITIDSKEYDVYSGDAFISFPNQIHTFQTIKREQYVLLKINPDLFPELSHVLTSTLPVSNVIRGIDQDEEAVRLICKISETYYKNTPYKNSILRGYLLAFLGLLLQKMELMDIQSGDYHVIGTIMNYCSTHYDKDLSLGVLERELHLNRYYISHIMNNKLRIGFNDYVNSLRISAACKLLEQDSMSITEISERVGFNTLRTFNRAFVKQMNCTPSDYRKKKKKTP